MQRKVAKIAKDQSGRIAERTPAFNPLTEKEIKQYLEQLIVVETKGH
jgi:hypothetical protein